MSGQRETSAGGLIGSLRGPDERRAIALLDAEIEKIANGGRADAFLLTKARGQVLRCLVALSRELENGTCASNGKHEWRGQWLDGNRVRWYCVHCRTVETVRA